MIVDERLVTYINSLDRGNTPVLDEIEKEALRDFVPIIRKEMQSFLKLLLAMQKPMRILEVGTAVGFSAVLMAEYAPKGCQIVTIENYEKRIPIAKANFERAGKKEQITLLEGDATEILPQLEGQFDMIFMDAAKGQYINFMPQVLRLLKTGGVLVSDNVLQDGDIAWQAEFFADEEEQGECLPMLSGEAAQSVFDGDYDEIELRQEWLEENTLHEWDEGEFQLEPSLDTEEGQTAADEWDER
mgnify:CR=1 FL=1